jgi:hypothetical protein
MAFDGAGNFLRLYNWVVDATNNVKIRADRHDGEDNNFASGLSNCICKDGQTAITQNIPWNNRRITAMADPVDAQDAATKAYADTKMPVSGGSMSGNLTVTGTVTSTSTVTATGYAARAGTSGAYSGNYFNFNWTGGNLEAWVDGTNLGPLATQAYANTAATNAAGTKLPLAGGTITGGLTVNGELVAVQNYLRFGASGGPGYIIWNGGANYALGGGGTIWHSGNFNPSSISSGTVTNARLVLAADRTTADFGNLVMAEPYGGAVLTGFASNWQAGYPIPAMFRWRYLQLYTTGWFTVGYA